jgi:L-lactate dehydrogenase complex protein LldG
MQETTSKEKILKMVRNALISTLENPFQGIDFKSPVFKKFADEPEVEFATQLNENGGVFVYCENEKDFTETVKMLANQRKWESLFSIDEKIIGLLETAGVKVESSDEKFTEQVAGITRCDFLIARFGSIMVSSGLSSGRRMFVFPEVHIVLAQMSQVVGELRDALKEMKKKYSEKLPSQITVITGPSRTADIEKTLVKGMHGPKELFVFVVDDL